MRRHIALPILALLTAAATTVSPAPAVAADPTPDPRIVGGNEPPSGAYPFMAAVVDRHRTNAWYGLLCGGAVIGPEWVVTAASCVAGKQASEIDVVTGRHDLSAAGGFRVHVAEISVHPSYSPGIHRYDGALLRLAAPVPDGTLELAPPDGTFLPATATIAGWGDTETADRFPRALRHADISLVSDEACDQIFGIDFDPPSMLCAGDPAVGANTCTGDRGGPLFAPQGDHWVLLGVSSWGVGCDVAGFPSVFAEISALWGWIHSTTGLGTLLCDGRPATIIGTEAADFLTGTNGPDVIAGLGGSDRIDALDGNDLVCAGAGNDQVFGGGGNDTLWGESGSDRLSGGAGDDVLSGGDGKDVLRGGNGDDRLLGSRHRDRIFGGAGADIIAGDAGNDSINGGRGDDRASGGRGADQIQGSAGNDTLLGDQGRDVIDGGDGDDEISGGSDADVLEGGRGCDHIHGNSGSDEIEGGDDDDLLDGGSEGDRIDGGNGDDLLLGRSGPDTLIGGLGTDTGIGGDGFDGCFVETSRACELPV